MDFRVAGRGDVRRAEDYVRRRKIEAEVSSLLVLRGEGRRGGGDTRHRSPGAFDQDISPFGALLTGGGPHTTRLVFRSEERDRFERGESRHAAEIPRVADEARDDGVRRGESRDQYSKGKSTMEGLPKKAKKECLYLLPATKVAFYLTHKALMIGEGVFAQIHKIRSVKATCVTEVLDKIDNNM